MQANRSSWTCSEMRNRNVLIHVISSFLQVERWIISSSPESSSMSSKHCGFYILPRICCSSPSSSQSHFVFQAEGPHRNVSNAHGELCATVPLVSPGQELRLTSAQEGKGAPWGSEGPQEARHGGDSESQTRMGVEPVLRAGGIYGIWAAVHREGKLHIQGSVIIKSLSFFSPFQYRTLQNMIKRSVSHGWEYSFGKLRSGVDVNCVGMDLL